MRVCLFLFLVYQSFLQIATAFCLCFILGELMEYPAPHCVYLIENQNLPGEGLAMKKFCRTVVAVLLLLSLCACVQTGEERRRQTLDELNENSDLPFALTLPETELGDTGDYQKGGGWGCYSLENEDIWITLSGYPDVLDPYHVTALTLRTPRYSIFNLRVGDTAGQAVEILKPRGYRSAPRDGRSILYEKDGVFIRLEFGDGKISALTVLVESTNVEDVDF